MKIWLSLAVLGGLLTVAVAVVTGSFSGCLFPSYASTCSTMNSLASIDAHISILEIFSTADLAIIAAIVVMIFITVIVAHHLTPPLPAFQTFDYERRVTTPRGGLMQKHSRWLSRHENSPGSLNFVRFLVEKIKLIK